MLGRWDMGRSIWYGLCPYLLLQGMEERPEIPQGQPAVSSQVCRGVVLLPKPSKEPPATHTHRHTLISSLFLSDDIPEKQFPL